MPLQKTPLPRIPGSALNVGMDLVLLMLRNHEVEGLRKHIWWERERERWGGEAKDSLQFKCEEG